MNQNSLEAYHRLDLQQTEEERQRIIAVLSFYPTDRSHLVRDARVEDHSIGWRLKELRKMGVIQEFGKCLSVSGKPATKIGLKGCYGGLI